MSTLLDPSPAKPPLTIRRLLNPGSRRLLFLSAAAAAIFLWSLLAWRASMPVWGATLAALAVVAVPMALKWQDDLQRYGLAAMLLSILLMLQAFHMLEHAVQMVQYYVLGRAPAFSFGLLSALNAEWVHFSWNWFVFALVVFLYIQGLRGPWAVLLMGWSLLHSLEHTYMLVRYLAMVRELREMLVSSLPVAQAQPGIFGRDGWLALSSFCGRIPGFTTAPRVAVHFWWNAGELGLLVLAAWRGLPVLIRRSESRANDTPHA